MDAEEITTPGAICVQARKLFEIARLLPDAPVSFKKEDNGGAGFKKLDISGTAIAGIQFSSGLFVNASGSYGFTKNMEGDGKYNSRSVGLTVGFLLN